MKTILLTSALLLLAAVPANAATIIDMDAIAATWGGADQGVTSKAYATTIDGIDTTITFSSNAGNLWASTFGPGIMGITGGGGIAGVEQRLGEVLTVLIAPTSATNILYTVNSGHIIGANANANSPTMAFTNAGGTTTYASVAIGGADSGDLTFSPEPSGVDSVSFTLRQTVITADTTEGGFLSDFTVTAVVVPEPVAFILTALAISGLALCSRRRRQS